jgi:leader peptidase (prepilin peptidase)/N-methyltransferase
VVAQRPQDGTAEAHVSHRVRSPEWFPAYFASLAIIDLRTRRLPNRLVYPGIVVALAAAPILPADGYLNGLIGGLVAFGTFAAIYFIAVPGVIGGGDVKLAPVIGAALGFPHALYALALGPMFIAVVAIPMILIDRWSLRSRVP